MSAPLGCSQNFSSATMNGIPEHLTLWRIS